jgi:EmrB/QacA subfamily drug resistance transporter
MKPVPRLRVMVASLLAVSFLGALDHTVVATSLATIAGGLGALHHMSLVIISYTLASTVLMPVIGRLGDVLGARRVFLAGLVLFLVASLFCGLAQTMTQLVVARVGQGVASAALQLMSQTIVARVAPPRERPRLLGAIGSAFPIAILVGPVLGGVITDLWGWPWVFWVNLPVGLLALALAVAAIPPIAPIPAAGAARGRFDLAGSLVFGVATVALVLAATWGSGGDPALVPAAVASGVVAVLGFAAFALVERRTPAPLIPLGLLAGRTVAVGLALSAVIGVGLFSIVSYVPTYVQMAYRVSPTVSGIVPIATVFGMLVSTLVTGSIASRTGRYRPFPLIGTAVGAAGLAGMALLPPALPLWVPVAVMAVVGAGTGAFMNLVVAIVQNATPASATGSATAAVNLVRQIGSTVATAIVGGVLAVGVAAGLPAGLDPATLTPELVHTAPAAVQADVADVYTSVLAPVFGALALVHLLGLLAALALPPGRLAADPVREPASPATTP